MTVIKEFEEKCSVCGKTSPQPVMMSTSTFGYPDLDLRPSEMKRSSMFAWLHVCPHCGYVASSLENELEVPCEILKSDEYLTCGGHDFKSKSSKMFYRQHLISKADNDCRSEFFSLLHCAWACDDRDEEFAVEIRKMALKSIDRIDAEDVDEKNNLILLKADLLRRSVQFDRLISEFKDVIINDKLYNDILSFQIEKAMEKDCGCYTVEDVLKDNNQETL